MIGGAESGGKIGGKVRPTEQNGRGKSETKQEERIMLGASGGKMGELAGGSSTDHQKYTNSRSKTVIIFLIFFSNTYFSVFELQCNTNCLP